MPLNVQSACIRKLINPQSQLNNISINFFFWGGGGGGGGLWALCRKFSDKYMYILALFM